MRSSIHENVRSLAMHKTPAPCQAIFVIAPVCTRHTIQSAAVSEELKHLREPAHKLAAGLLNPCLPFVNPLWVHAKAQSMHRAGSD